MTLHLYRERAAQLWRVGTLHDDGAFSYATSYLADSDARALSFSLPLQTAPFTPAQALPYFRGLLPEGRALAHLAARLGRSEDDYLGLLGECGLDCVGDIIICPETYTGNRQYRRTSLAELRTAFSRSVPHAAADAAAASRLSLAGTQDKLGLYVAAGASGLADDSQWYLPQGGAPSNCILKIAPTDTLPDLMIAEQLGMACARTCGLAVADTELAPLGRGALVVRRFDRTKASGETIAGLPAPLRQHQEDFTQALGLSAGSKYAELPGGTAAAIAAFLRAHSAAPAKDVTSLLEIGLFNYALGNADNHLKNLSVCYGPGWKTIRLAPAYDLVPTTYYTRFSRTMGMALGSTRDIDAVTAADLRSFAAQVGVSQRLLKRVAERLSTRIVPALRTEAKRLDERGFGEAFYFVDNLEEDMAPRLEVLRAV